MGGLRYGPILNPLTQPVEFVPPQLGDDGLHLRHSKSIPLKNPVT